MCTFLFWFLGRNSDTQMALTLEARIARSAVKPACSKGQNVHLHCRSSSTNVDEGNTCQTEGREPATSKSYKKAGPKQNLVFRKEPCSRKACGKYGFYSFYTGFVGFCTAFRKQNQVLQRKTLISKSSRCKTRFLLPTPVF